MVDSTIPDYNIDESKGTVAGQLGSILDKDSPLMQKAATTGQQYANKRGLLNSSIGAGATQSAMMDYAMPIAQQDASTYSKFEGQKYGAKLGQDTLAKTTAANTQGAYLDSINEITNNAMVSINEIETAEGITQADKDKMIANTISRRNADLAWTKNLYSNMPTWDFSWIGTGENEMPAAPGL